MHVCHIIHSRVNLAKSEVRESRKIYMYCIYLYILIYAHMHTYIYMYTYISYVCTSYVVECDSAMHDMYIYM